MLYFIFRLGWCKSTEKTADTDTNTHNTDTDNTDADTETQDADRQTDKERKTDRKKDRQKDTHTQTLTNIHTHTLTHEDYFIDLPCTFIDLKVMVRKKSDSQTPTATDGLSYENCVPHHLFR